MPLSGGVMRKAKKIKVMVDAEGNVRTSEPISIPQLQRLEKEWWTNIRTVERLCDVKYIGENPHTGVFVPWWAWEGHLQLIRQSVQ